MYKPDEDIDRLSREAAEHYHAPGKPAWDTLRETLDKELPQEKEKKRRGFLFFFLLALGLSLAGSTIWYSVRKNSNTTAVNLAVDQKTTLQSNTVPENNAPLKETNRPETVASAPAPGQPSGAKEVVTAKKAALPMAATVAKNKGAVKSAEAPVATPAPVREKAALKSNRKNNTIAVYDAAIRKAKKLRVAQSVPPRKQRQYSAPAGMGADDAETGNDQTARSTGKKKKTATGKTVITDDGTPPVNSAGIDTTAHAVINTNSAELPGTGTTDHNSKPAAAPVDTIVSKPAAAMLKTDSSAPAATKVKKKSTNDKAILLGITGGMDMSTVKYTYGSNLGYNIGFAGGYQFNKHWSVYTGIVYTKKNYKLNGQDYHPPQHYWTMYVNLETVEGYCRMWELPVTARYTFNPQSRTAFFVNGGLSSYFMKKQSYEYLYKTNSGMPGTSAWTDDSSFNHIFSILDLSFGVQKQIGKHMNWQIEPYAKIPLGGVGFGNIRLSSFGINLTMQYRQPLKR